MSTSKKRNTRKKEIEVTDYNSFWKWFMVHEQSFYNAVKNRDNVEVNFFDQVVPQLQKLNRQFHCSLGMFNNTLAGLIITAEGDIKTFVFAEELIAAAPVLERWSFTALKQAVKIEHMHIEMNGYLFNNQKIHFFSNDHKEYPDRIDLTMVHADFNKANEETILNGTFIYLDSVLGELNAATLIDSMRVTGISKGQPDLIPIDKLKDFLLWREKEFVEKYDGLRFNTENDLHAVLEGEDEDGIPIVAVVNHALLTWEAKPSHPWMMVIEMQYEKLENGMPGDASQALINRFEEELIPHLPESEGYLLVAKEFYNGVRKLYYACNEFRRVSKIVASVITGFSEEAQLSYNIYKDKYWISVNKFNNHDPIIY